MLLSQKESDPGCSDCSNTRPGVMYDIIGRRSCVARRHGKHTTSYFVQMKPHRPLCACGGTRIRRIWWMGFSKSTYSSIGLNLPARHRGRRVSHPEYLARSDSTVACSLYNVESCQHVHTRSYPLSSMMCVASEWLCPPAVLRSLTVEPTPPLF